MLDLCDLEHAVGDCSATGTTPCYRTRATCQSTADYTATATALSLSTAHQAVPPGFQCFPCIEDIEHVPTKIDMKGGMGRHDQVVVTCNDFTDDSTVTDPYYSRRAARRVASFFAMLKARNKHYPNRTLYVDEGYIGDDGRVVESSMTTRQYVIEQIEGPTNGTVKIHAKDVLWRLETAMIPVASAGALNADITAVASSFVVEAGDGAAYGDAPFTVRIDDEIITVGARSTDTFSTLTRGAWGTTAAEHESGTTVQKCKVWEDETVDTVWGDICTDGGVDAALQDTTGTASEAETWYDAYLLTACISTPTPAADLMADLTQQLGAFTWWDSENQLARFRGIHPLEADDTPSEFDDTAHVVARSVSVRDVDSDRVSRVDYRYGVRDWSQSLTERANYLRGIIAIDASAETADEYDEVRDTREIFGYFCPKTMSADVNGLALRILARYRDAPRMVVFDLVQDDATVDAGDLVKLTVREIVDADGASNATTMWLVARSRVGVDSPRVRYEALVDEDQTSARWWYWNADDAADYDDATDEEKRCAYWADDATEQVGDDAPYCWI
jgi:hypothetical protein